MRLQRISKTISEKITLEDVKTYANITGTSRDEELSSMLLSAICKVEDILNVSLSPNALRLITEGAVTRQRLYLLPVKTIVSCKDAVTGEDVSYKEDCDKSQIFFSEPSDVVIEYTTEPLDINIQIYKHNVLEYCSALFDGVADNNVLGKILSKIQNVL